MPSQPISKIEISLSTDNHSYREIEQRLDDIEARQAGIERFAARLIKRITTITLAERLATVERRQEKDAETFGEHARQLAALENAVKERAMRTELQGEKNYLNERLDLELELIQQIAKQLEALESQAEEARQERALADLENIEMRGGGDPYKWLDE